MTAQVVTRLHLGQGDTAVAAAKHFADGRSGSIWSGDQPGNGRETGVAGFEECRQAKSLAEPS